MSLPGWDEPDPAEEATNSRPDPAAEAGPEALAAGAVRRADRSEDLTVKPVLDWTDEDWARWIDDAGSRPVPRPVEAAADEAAADEAAADEAAADEAAPWAPLGGGDVGAGLADGDDWIVLDTALPADADPEPVAVDLGPAGADPPGKGAWSAADRNEEPAPDDSPGQAGLPPSITGSDDRVAAAAISAHVDPGAPPGHDDEWAGVADHPWWESAPAADNANPLDLEPGTHVDTAPARVPVPTPPAPREPPTDAPQLSGATSRSPARPTRPMPAAPVGGTGAGRPRPVAPDPSHRVRSAFGLLVVAVTVGAVMAGLITVALFAISLALRHAVG